MDSADSPVVEQRSVLIRRYPNRKLYSTEISKYITLEGVYALIKDGADVTVINKETDEDITTNVILTAISEIGKNKVRGELLEMLEVITGYVKNTKEQTLEGGSDV